MPNCAVIFKDGRVGCVHRHESELGNTLQLARDVGNKTSVDDIYGVEEVDAFDLVVLHPVKVFVQPLNPKHKPIYHMVYVER